MSVFLYFLLALEDQFFMKILLQGHQACAVSPANTPEGHRRKSLNRNPTGNGEEGRVGARLPPSSPQRPSEFSGGTEVKWKMRGSQSTKASLQDSGCGRTAW